MMPSGDRFRLLVSARDEKTAWAQAIYSDDTDVARAQIMWKPLLPGSTRWLAWRTEADPFRPDRRRARRIWRSVTGRDRGHVGPGGRTSRSVRLGTKSGMRRLVESQATPPGSYVHDLLKDTPRPLLYVPVPEERIDPS